MIDCHEIRTQDLEHDTLTTYPLDQTVTTKFFQKILLDIFLYILLNNWQFGSVASRKQQESAHRS